MLSGVLLLRLFTATHRFKDAYMRAINTLHLGVPGVGFSVPREICFLLDRAQQLWLTSKPSGQPGKYFPSRREYPGETALECPAFCVFRGAATKGLM